jgi:hypothetical protein
LNRDREFRNVGTGILGAGDSPKRKNTVPGVVEGSWLLGFIAIFCHFEETCFLILWGSKSQ